MSSWFLGGASGSPSNLNDGSSLSSKNRPSVQDLIPHLYPQSASSTTIQDCGGTAQGGAGGWFGGGGGGISDVKQGSGGGVVRFSSLLLEHGEQPIQDWAAVVYTAPWKAGLAAANANRTTNHGSRSNTNVSANSSGGNNTGNGTGTNHEHSNKIQWAQAPQQTPNATSSQGAANRQRSLKNMASTLSSSSALPVRSASDITKDEYPTVHMTKIAGRLYLCSRSLVFEPDDVSRAVIRCPWSRTQGLTSVESDEWSIQLYTNRHIAMKVNNILGPFESIHIPTKFRFTFLHSKPQAMMDLAQRLYHAVNHTDGPAPSPKSSVGTTLGPAEAELQIYQQQQQPSSMFDMDNLADVVREQLLLPPIAAKILTPLQSQGGVVVLTSAERLYFQPTHVAIGNNSIKKNNTHSQRALRWKCADIVATARRYYGLRDSALEIYWKPSGGRSSSRRRSKDNMACSTLIAFERRHDREQVLQLLPSTVTCVTDREFLTKVVEEWLHGKISNYDYLLALNSAAGRSFHDLSRYPVFPWVLSDYEADTPPDLDNPQSFRDLSKPMGALNPERLKYFQTRLANMQDLEKDMFLYGTHYSAPAYVLYYLVRTMPEHMLCLQNGKFDAADRMFYSISHCYQCCLSNHADVKELIPQFYSLDKFDVDFLRNAHALSLGATQTGERVHDVLLPPWANESPKKFIQVNRQALESVFCTQQLPAWVDLIFGASSRGDAAKQANNLFHRMSYLGPRELADASPEERATAELQATEFGIVPDQLFQQAHPLPSQYQELNNKDTTAVDMESFLAPHVGRSSSMNADAGGREAWELLDAPVAATSSGQAQPADESTSDSQAMTDRQDGAGLNSYSFDGPGTSKKMPLRGSGETSAALSVETTMNPFDSSDIQQHSQSHSQQLQHSKDSPPQPIPLEAAPPTPVRKIWDMKMLERRQLHSDAVSGCVLLLTDKTDSNLAGDSTEKKSLLVTTSLDGGLMVHKVSLNKPNPVNQDQSAQNFSSTFSRFSYSSILSRPDASPSPTSAAGATGHQPQPTSKLTEYRTHSSRDPLASLVVASDNATGHVAFAGGHDDVVLAYGINSACAVASVYSHRDAVTGLDLIQRGADPSSSLWLDNATHIMVSGSWDATVKVWSACVSAGETVSIHREPLAELFDADSSISCVSACSVSTPGAGGGIVIAAGCADGSFCVWNIHSDGMQVILHKEPPSRRGAGPCSSIQWVRTGRSGNGDGNLHLFCSFSTGKIASYVLVDGSSRLLSSAAVSVGVPILKLVYSEGVLLVGCSDGGLRLVPVTYRRGDAGVNGFFFDSKPTLWKAVNSKSAPGICSISITYTTTMSKSTGADGQQHQAKKRCICCTGAEDGSVALFELKIAPSASPSKTSV
mmetsp:Transcript_4395/g.12138  ORF Transcript_4395/g.12138 Transcript_4395/m.12138 type:complete len:1379 (-) Transcript_4395:1280-5416(-)|eukprot:CAMPEP_0168722338 /NCGR_PEP_ID=MMETSP0724-20121128/2548_1 /TAXON_ID=265536 /ORGANISM="Amphiprora sp., Strain CCMP467" /LENGTH=1378 /DNA_ID=CAMNT_0008769011 /DNA_START=182 /DNA_END=4318 /DNA_ORIENTATION=-